MCTYIYMGAVGGNDADAVVLVIVVVAVVVIVLVVVPVVIAAVVVVVVVVVGSCCCCCCNWRFGRRRDRIFSSFDGSVEVWSESVLLGLKLLFGSTQRPHFCFKLDDLKRSIV